MTKCGRRGSARSARVWTAATCCRSGPGMQAVPTSIPEGTRQPTGALRGRDRSADFGNAAGFVRRSQSGSKLPHSIRWRADHTVAHAAWPSSAGHAKRLECASLLALLDAARLGSPISGGPMTDSARRSQSGSKPRNSIGWRAAERTSDNVAPWQMRALTVRTGKICYQ